jgi:hypothetical protein
MIAHNFYDICNTAYSKIYLEFIRQYGILSLLHCNNAKSEMSQGIRQIHSHLVIANRWKESHIAPGKIQRNYMVLNISSHIL